MANDIAVSSNNADLITADRYVGVGNKLSISFPGFNAEANGALGVAFLAVMVVAITIRRRPPRRH